MEKLKSINEFEIYELQKRAIESRLIVLEMMKNGASGHIGGSYSCLDILISLYSKIMKINKSENRDRFVLSKGHAECALYAVLYAKNYYSIKYLNQLKKLNSPLQGHPSSKWLKCIDYSTGSLGQGLSFAVGQAICGKEYGFNVYVVVGDGELQEGQIWEAVMVAAKFILNNLTVFVDCNKYQLETMTQVTGDVSRMQAVWRSFGWETSIIDGHNFEQIISECIHKENKPKVIFANTVKGKGISFMENNNDFHGKNLTSKELALANKELEQIYSNLLEEEAQIRNENA